MIVRLIKKTKIYNFTLPTKIAGNYWITDNDYLGNKRNLINVEEYNNEWKIKSNFETKIMLGDNEMESAIIKEYSIYFLKISTDNEFVILYCSPSLEPQINRLAVKDNCEILIGNDPTANINYNYPLVSKEQARLVYNDGNWLIEDLNSKYGTYVNNFAIQSKALKYGDIVFIMGLKIVVLKNQVIINSIGNLVTCDQNIFELYHPWIQKQTEYENPDEETIEFYKEEDYFYRAPRFKTMIEPVNITIDAPPGKIGQGDKTPAIYTMGPMLSMAVMSAGSGFGAVQALIDGTKDLQSVLPALVTTGVMLSTMLVWPALNKSYQKRQNKKREIERQQKYTAYIELKRKEIADSMKTQRQILIDNYLPLKDTKEIIYNKKRTLWEREIEQADFLDLRLGIGSTELSGKVNFPQQHFSLDSDNLLKLVYRLGSESRILEDVPISMSFIDKNISAIIGTAINKQAFIEGLILQMITYHSYEDLKIVLFTNEENKSKWEYLKICPHCWNNNKTERYIATNIDEAKEISLYLEQELQKRKYKDNNDVRELNNLDYKHFSPYYVIITDNYKEVRDIELIKDVSEQKINIGFSLITISPRLVNIPNECKAFISIGDKKSGVFENELVSNKQKEFVADYDNDLDMHECCKIIANIPIDIAKENRALPKSLSFLEMYNVGMVEQLNIFNRWKSNDPTKSLQAAVGFDNDWFR